MVGNNTSSTLDSGVTKTSIFMNQPSEKGWDGYEENKDSNSRTKTNIFMNKPSEKGWGGDKEENEETNTNTNKKTDIITNLPRKVGTEMRRKTKRHPLLVYKLVFATTRAANRVHFVLKTKFSSSIGKILNI